MLSRFGARTLRDAVSILHTYTYIGPDSGLLEDASDKPGESPVMRVYHALIVLAREAARADAFPDACLRLVAGRSMTAAMLPCGIDPWVQCATRNLERCPGVFQLLLRSRVTDAVARASIGDVPCLLCVLHVLTERVRAQRTCTQRSASGWICSGETSRAGTTTP